MVPVSFERPFSARRASMSDCWSTMPNCFSRSRSPVSALERMSLTSVALTCPPVHSDSAPDRFTSCVLISDARWRWKPIGIRMSCMAAAALMYCEVVRPIASAFFFASAVTAGRVMPNTVWAFRLRASIWMPIPKSCFPYPSKLSTAKAPAAIPIKFPTPILVRFQPFSIPLIACR